jgi:hypothetical protein
VKCDNCKGARWVDSAIGKIACQVCARSNTKMNPTHKKQGIRTPHSVLWRYRPETVVAANKLPVGSQEEAKHKFGMQEGEPLIVIMDALLNYAEAYRDRQGEMLATDGVLGQPWLEAARGIRALLNGQGAIAMRKDISTDTFDGGAVEGMFWNAMGMAGFTEEDLT